MLCIGSLTRVVLSSESPINWNLTVQVVDGSFLHKGHMDFVAVTVMFHVIMASQQMGNEKYK